MARTKQTKRKRQRGRAARRPDESDHEPTEGLAKPKERQEKPATDADRGHPGVQDGGVKKRRRRDRRDRPPRPADAADSIYGIHIRQYVKNFKVEELSIKVVDGFITIEGQRQNVGDDEDPNTVRRSFNHRHRLPFGLDPESLTSTLSSDGVLIVTAPKVAPAPSRILTIVETGEPAPPPPEPLPVVNEVKVKTEVPEAPLTEAVNNVANENDKAPA